MLEQIKNIIEYFKYTNRVNDKETSKIVENIIYSAIQQDKEEHTLEERLQQSTVEVKCKIRQGLWRQGKTGKRLGKQNFICNNQEWTPLLWDNEAIPGFHKTVELDFYT